jgi:hypothetical protein
MVGCMYDKEMSLIGEGVRYHLLLFLPGTLVTFSMVVMLRGWFG